MFEKKILVYGSLRPSEYNYKRFKDHFGKDLAVVKFQVPITNYKMFDLGSYPGIVYSSDMKDTIMCDILEMSEQCYQLIYNMEIGAGYQVEEVGIILDGLRESFPIFALPFIPKHCNLVESGDWVQYNLLKKKEKWQKS